MVIIGDVALVHAHVSWKLLRAASGTIATVVAAASVATCEQDGVADKGDGESCTIPPMMDAATPQSQARRRSTWRFVTHSEADTGLPPSTRRKLAPTGSASCPRCSVCGRTILLRLFLSRSSSSPSTRRRSSLATIPTCRRRVSPRTAPASSGTSTRPRDEARQTAAVRLRLTTPPW